MAKRVLTQAEARRNVLRAWARNNPSAHNIDDVNTAKMSLLMAAYVDVHQHEPLSEQIDVEILDHAGRNGLVVRDTDLINTLDRYSNHPYVRGALTSSQVSQGTEDTADAVLASMSDEDENAGARIGSSNMPANQDKAQEALTAIMGDMASGNYPKAKQTIQDMLDAANTAAHAASPVIQAPTVSGPVDFVGEAKLYERLPSGVVPKDLKGDGPSFADYDGPKEPDLSYVWPEGSIWALHALAHGKPVFLTGPAGTGKTSWAKEVAMLFGRPFVRVSCHDQTEGPTLTGMTVPTVDGGAEWKDGALVRAMRIPGCVILIDEPSVARPGALMVLQAVLDHERALVVEETGERVGCADHVMLIVADNTNGAGDTSGAYAGTRHLNHAFMDRFGAVLPVGYLPRNKEAGLLHDRTNAKKSLCVALVKYAEKTRIAAEEGKLVSPVSFRRLMDLASLMSQGAPSDMAFTLAVGSRASPEDVSPLREIWQTDFADPKHVKTLI